MWFQQMHQDWQIALSSWRPWLDALENSLRTETTLAPEAHRVMTALAVSPDVVRVVILGQDPYPTPGHAVGRAFAVDAHIGKLPASLKNIFKELESDTQSSVLPKPDLESWQEQGVLLLNAHLTTLQGHPGAHSKIGWNEFTFAALQHLISLGKPIAFVLWGSQAQDLVKRLSGIDGNSNILILKSAHPSPLSAYRGFFGSKPFSQVNNWLGSMGSQKIDWNR